MKLCWVSMKRAISDKTEWSFFGWSAKITERFSRIAKKQLQNINLFSIKLKYLKLCGYDEHNKYSVST